MSRQKIILRILLWSLALAAVGGAGGVLLGGNETVLKIAASGFFTGVAALLLLPLSRMADKPSQRAAGLGSSIVVIVEFLLSVLALFTESEEAFILMMSLVLPGVAMGISLRIRPHREHNAAGIAVKGN